jgi:hypothetical protein
MLGISDGRVEELQQAYLLFEEKWSNEQDFLRDTESKITPLRRILMEKI